LAADFFCHKYRNISIYKQMSTRTMRFLGGRIMEFLVPLGIVALWFILQIWVLPRLGVRT